MQQRAQWFGFVGALFALVLFYFTAQSLVPFFSDDALISLRYAQRLASGDGLTWTNGDHTEGYTDFLWVLLQVPGFWLRVEPVLWARIIGFLGAGMALIFTTYSTQAQAPFRQIHWARTLAVGSLFSLSVPLATWAIGGLEHGFMCGPLIAGVYFMQRWLGGKPISYAPMSLCFSSVCLARADGALFVAFGFAGIILTFGNSWIQRIQIGAKFIQWPLLTFAAQTLFRKAYTNEWIPNTAVAKVAFNFHRVDLGFQWVKSGLLASFPLFALALLGFLLMVIFGQWRKALIPFFMTVGWCSYLVVVGGDIFPAFRQLVPALSVLVFVVAECFESISTRFRFSWVALLPAAISLGFYNAEAQRENPEHARALSERWEWEGKPLGTMLHDAALNLEMVKEKNVFPLLAVDAAGALPFWSRLPALDMLGLNDSYIAKHPPIQFGYGGIGHELGDGAYVLRRKPDLIAFCNASGTPIPCFLSGKQMVATPSFHQEYRRVQYGHEASAGTLFVRFSSGPMAAQWSQNEAKIPPWFFASEPPSQWRLSPQGKSVVQIGGESVGSVDFELPAGIWIPQISGAGTPIYSWRCDGLTATRMGPGSSLQVAQPTRVTLEIRSQVPIEIEFVNLKISTANSAFRCAISEPIVVSSNDVLIPRKNGISWNAPGVTTITKSGLRILLEKPLSSKMIELSTDNNDIYLIRFLTASLELARVELKPDAKEPGLVTSQLLLPESALRATEILIVPIQGDNAYSIGHLRELSER
jgi:arabinofuranosyltransferase